MTVNTTTRTLACAAGALALGLPFFAVAAAAAEESDTTAPVSTVNIGTPPASGWYRANVPVRLTADDFGGSGVTSIDYRIGDGPVVSTGLDDVSLSITVDGVTTITLWSVDAAGNLEAAHDFTVRIDRGAPVITFATPTSVELGEDVTFDLSCTDAHSGVASCDSNIADGSPLPTDTVGEHRVTVSSTDVAGNLASTEFVYEVLPDTTGPVVSLAIAPVPASGWYTTGLGVAVRASDRSGVGSIHWSTDGPVSSNGDVVGEPEALFGLTVDGVTELTYWAYDGFGNRAEGAATIRIDTVAPLVRGGSASLAAAVPEFVLGSRAALPVACDDETSGVAECGILEAPSGVVPTDALGLRTVTLYATDVAGNRTEQSFEYRVVAPATPGGAGDADDLETLAQTGAEPAGLVLAGAALAGAGAVALGGRRLLARR